MRLTLKGGAEIDIMEKADFDQGVGRIVDALKQARRAPDRVDFQDQGIADANGALTLQVQCAVGFVYHLVHLNIFDPRNPGGSVSGIGVVSTDSVQAFDIVDLALQLPAVGMWGEKEIISRNGQPIFVVLSGLPANQNIMITGQCIRRSAQEDKQ